VPVMRGIHPVSEIFPRLNEAALAELVADIRANGLREPLTINAGGLLLDGRNRLAACEVAGVTPTYRVFDGDPLAFVVSANVHRRHLDTSQRAMVAARIATMRQGERTDLEPTAHLQNVSRAHAASLLRVSPRSVADAHRVQERGVPELVRAVEAGEMAVSAAARVASLEPQDQREQLSNPSPEAETYTQPRTSSEPRSPSPLKAADKRDLREALEEWSTHHRISMHRVNTLASKLGLGHCQRTDDEVPFEFRWEHNGENNDSNQDPMG
jgi:ParB-like chromosome segregation protein Spo0J